ncbi:MAG: SusC/RagA family TonB-linked outer membrane protein [Prevotella sp.]|nr:SusC/RagA family TonB-linked outer membrane protein [Prevotella sp.]
MKRIYGMILLLTMVLNSTAQTEKRDSVELPTVRVGYSKGNQNTLAGAVDQVTEARMNKGLITSSLDALTGQAAGVQVTNDGNQEAMVSAVRVRGTTSLTGNNNPLVIIDGVTSDLDILSTIYPADIESFTILKDASETAQYGSRGATGVIEVATKKGKNQKFQISYDGSIGFERVFKRTEMMNADEYRRACQRFGLSYIDLGYDTDFRKAIERTGFVQNHHVAFGGGTETANYRASVGMMEHNTVVKTQSNKSYIAKLDITQIAFNNRLTVDLGMTASLHRLSYPPFKQELLYSAATFNPTFPETKNALGEYDQVTEAIWINNPLSLLDMTQDEDNGHFNVHMKAKVILSKNLTLRVFGSYSFSNIDDSHYYPISVWNRGQAYRQHEKTEDMLGNISLTYILNLSHSTLNVMALAEAENTKKKGFYVTSTGFTTDAFGYDKLSAGVSQPWDGTDSYYTDSHMQSLLMRAQYTLLDRYTLTVNARGDASSKFGKNHRWGFFPSASAAWVISKEPWMKKQKFINNAKLRIGYGLSGNQAGIDSYNSMQLIQPNGVVPVGDTPAVTLGTVRNANPDLKWEIKRTFNIGLDLTFWNNRIAITIDNYRSKTTDMLYVYDVPVPPYTYDKLLANLGSMESFGLEIGFGITPLRTKDVDLAINMNWTFERNKLLSLDGYYNGQYLTAPSMKGISALWGAGFHGSSDVCYQIVGEQLGVFYLPHCNGLIVDEDGSKWYDIDDEKQICGQATPKAMMGSNIAFRYKQWDMTMQINGAFGHKIFNGNALTYNNVLSLPNYNVAKGADIENIQDQTISDYYLESGDYVNIDYINVGWNVPIRSKYIQALRLSASVNNLATITGYSGLTPMINSSVINGSLGIDDKNVYPVYRSYTMGLSVKF